MRIRDTGWKNSYPGTGMDKFGSGMEKCLSGKETFGSGIEKFGSGMEKIRIRDKHLGSDTDCTVN
jgi:hypothetical protein